MGVSGVTLNFKTVTRVMMLVTIGPLWQQSHPETMERQTVKGSKPTVHLGREGRRQEREAGAHISSTVRKQREMDAGTQLTFSFLFIPGSKPRECHCP